MTVAKDVETQGAYQTQPAGYNRFEELVNLLPQAVLEIQFDGTLLFSNWHCRKLFGYGIEETVENTKNVFEHIARADHEVIIRRIAKMLNGEKARPPEITAVRKDGTTFSAIVYANLIMTDDMPSGVRVVIADITEKKEVEEAYKALVDHSLQGLIIIQDERPVFVNDYFVRESGFTREELLSLPVGEIREMVHPEARAALVKIHRHLLTGRIGRAPVLEYRVFVKGPEGPELRWVADYSARIEYGGRPAVQTALVDVTERKLAEIALRESETLYRKLFEQHAAVKLIVDPDSGRIIDANGAAIHYYGWPIDKLKKMKIQDIDTLSPGEVKVQTEEARTNKRVHFEVRHRKADGSIRDVEVFSSRIEIKGKDFLHSIIHDIADRKRAEAELQRTVHTLNETKDLLVQSEKLAAIGRLSAGVGHEILNPVNIASMRIQLLERGGGLPGKVRDGFSQIKNQLDRIVRITKDLSQFSRITKREIVEKNLNEVVEHILYLVGPRLKFEQVSLEKKLQTDLPKIMMEPDRIEQVILNVVNNAVDALAGRENKFIRVKTVLVKKGDKESLQLAISDNGRGISPGDENILFEPFFTTKEEGKGTGLGLYICYNIIQDHGGRIWAENNATGGASFVIELPAGNKLREV